MYLDIGGIGSYVVVYVVISFQFHLLIFKIVLDKSMLDHF